MKNRYILILLTLAFSLFPCFQLQAVITTSSTVTGEDVRWSLIGVSDSDIHFSHRIALSSSAEAVYYTVKLNKGADLTVQADIPNARQLSSSLPSSQRKLAISIPSKGTRWVAGKQWYESSGQPQPTSVTLKHRQQFNPYQANPPYIDSRHQLDKHVYITDITFTYEEGPRSLYIYIVPQIFVGLNPRDYGLPEFARTEPDYKYKKPLGCNGCSEIGIPGYRVNMLTLLPVVQDTLYQWAGRGPSVKLALTWNAKLGAGTTDFGTGWRFSYDSWLTESSEGVTIQKDDGGQQQFPVPTAFNANVTSVVANPSTGDSTVNIIYVTQAGEPAYTTGWDGQYDPDSSGYLLKKDLAGDPAYRTFTLIPPDEKIRYIYQGPSGNLDPLPLVAIEDWNGNRLQITRNTAGAITQITDAVNRSATLTYNLAGQCTKLTVPGNRELLFSYNGSDLVRVVDLIANQIDYTYSASHAMTAMSVEGRTWQFAWITENDAEHIASVTDPESNTTQYAIVNSSFDLYRTRLTDATGRAFTYNYPKGVYTGSDREQTPTVVSDNLGRPVEVTPKGGSVTTRRLQYNDVGLVSRVDELDGGVHQYTYNSSGLLTEYLDALNNSWKTQYDPAGNVTRSESPTGRFYLYTYDGFGQPWQTTDPAGNMTVRTYDTFGNLKTVTDAEGAITTFGYDATGIELTSITDPLGNITTFTYDDNRRPLRTTHPDGTYREILYDCCAPIGYRNEKGDVRTITRSQSLKILRETDFMGTAVNYTYDGAGRQVATRSPDGTTVITSYNDLGQPSSVQDPLGDRVSWEYYSNTDELFSHTLSQDPPAQADIGMSWRGVPARANGWQFGRDVMGRLLRTITPNYKYINFSRDADGLLTGKDYDGTPVATFSRDANGLLASTTHPLGTDTYQRNGRGQVTRLTWYDGHVSDFTYTGNGRIATILYPDSSTATYSYDNRGRTTSISWKGATLDTQYDALGNITAEQRSNGVQTAVMVDKNSQPTRVHHYTTLQTLLDLQCTRNVFGLLTRCDKTGDVFSWSPALTAGNSNSAYTYNRSFTLVTHDGQPAATDVNGNQTVIPGTRAFSGSYNYQNLLTDWTTSSSTNQAVYDGQSRLIQLTRNGIVRRFHYDDQDRLLFETEGAGTLTVSWLYRGRQVVAMADGSGVYFYHTDLSANVAFLSDSAGQVAAAYRYLPFGLKTFSSGTVSNPFTFVGTSGVLDLEEGLYYMRSRTYDAATQAFLSNDPMGLGVTPNAREYAGNNPVNWIDPDGLFSITSQYSEDGAVCPRVGADFDNKVYNAPTTPTPYEDSYGPSPNAIDVSCLVDTAWNVAASGKKYGTKGGVTKIVNHLVDGEYGDAATEAASTAAGSASKAARFLGPLVGFVLTPSRCGETEEDIEKARKAAEETTYDRNTRHDIESYDFTIPPFTLDE